MKRGHVNVAKWLLAFGLVTSAGYSTADFVPPDLPAGSPYQIVFVTSGVRDAYATYLYSYNAHVREYAAQSSTLPVTQWWAIVSVGGSAQSNAAVHAGVPVYNTAGQFVADGSTFYSGTHQASLAFDQNGRNHLATVWTGIEPTGAVAYRLGGGMPAGTYGRSAGRGPDWSSDYWYPNMNQTMSIYGLSDIVTAVPEPAPVTWVIGATLLIVGVRNRR